MSLRAVCHDLQHFFARVLTNSSRSGLAITTRLFAARATGTMMAAAIGRARGVLLGRLADRKAEPVRGVICTLRGRLV
jgi:2-keto-3-deoxy-galactonokinase